MTEIRDLTALELLRHYRRGALSPVDVARDVLARVERYNPTLNAFCHLHPEETLAAAADSEARWRKGAPIGLLDGLPVTLKDMILQKGHPNRRGSRASDPTPASEDAPSTARLREAGAVFIGRTTLPEFAWKGVCDSPLTGITRNPWNSQMTPGGSSGGAAVAGALNLGVLHIGTDAGGSIRIPCSFCGLFGLKPTFGRVPTYPASPFVALSHVGPMTRTVDDAALMLSVIAGPDHRDMNALNTPAPDYRSGLDRGVRGLKIAWSPRLGYVSKLDPEVEALCSDAARALAELGAIVEQADPGFADPHGAILAMWQAGAAAVLRTIPAEMRSQMDPGFIAAAGVGATLSAADFLAAYNARAQLSRRMAEFHMRYDLLVTPTVATPPFEAGRDAPAGDSLGSEWLGWTPYSYPFNLTLQPAATVPCGVTKAGLPVGLQIIGPMRQDDVVLAAAKAFERARPFARLTEPR